MLEQRDTAQQASAFGARTRAHGRARRPTGTNTNTDAVARTLACARARTLACAPRAHRLLMNSSAKSDDFGPAPRYSAMYSRTSSGEVSDIRKYTSVVSSLPVSDLSCRLAHHKRQRAG